MPYEKEAKIYLYIFMYRCCLHRDSVSHLLPAAGIYTGWKRKVGGVFYGTGLISLPAKWKAEYKI